MSVKTETAACVTIITALLSFFHYSIHSSWVEFGAWALCPGLQAKSVHFHRTWDYMNITWTKLKNKWSVSVLCFRVKQNIELGKVKGEAWFLAHMLFCLWFIFLLIGFILCTGCQVFENSDHQNIVPLLLFFSILEYWAKKKKSVKSWLWHSHSLWVKFILTKEIWLSVVFKCTLWNYITQ